MRALWIVRDNLETHPGGDTTQILRTKDGLERLGVSIELAGRLVLESTGFNVVHLFHLDRLWEHLAVCGRLRTARIPAVLSTIYWPADEYDRGGRPGVQGAMARLLGSDNYQTLRQLQRCAPQGLRGWDRRLLSFRRGVRYLLDTVAVILPNSVAEQEVIEQRFGAQRPAVVVPNAADVNVFTLGSAEAATDRSGVLCVGRIEPRKNQLALIEALRDSRIPLTLVGQAGRFSRRYAERCRRFAGDNVRFVGHCNATELRGLYRRARVHVNVSWYETPGLASLEAALCGCNIVVTPGGCTREYFGEDAHYCAPDDRRSIRAAVEAALAAEPKPDLAERVRHEFNWDGAARSTLRGYELALETTRT
jgi:glycosyltransferase involved in cell wall biosynthesis